MPIGTPSTSPTRAIAVDCQPTAAPTCIFTKPITFKTVTSLRRRATLTKSSDSTEHRASDNGHEDREGKPRVPSVL